VVVVAGDDLILRQSAKAATSRQIGSERAAVQTGMRNGGARRRAPECLRRGAIDARQHRDAVGSQRIE